MENHFLIFNNLLFIQIFENSKSELLYESIEYLFLFICLIMALLAMMLIPAILCYFMVDNFIDLYEYNKKINTKICTSKNEHTKEYAKTLVLNT